MKLLRNLLKSVRDDSAVNSSAPEPVLTIGDIIYNLKLLGEIENNISEFYSLCADVLNEEKHFWVSMAGSEKEHAQNIEKMIGLIEKGPKNYRPGYPFNAASIRAFGLYLQDLLSKMKEGMISEAELIFIAKDIEDSAVELNYAKIVETDNKDYGVMARRIDAETEEHRKVIRQRVEKASRPEGRSSE